MLVKELIPYISNRRIEIMSNGKLLCMMFSIDGKRKEVPASSYHAVRDSKVIYITATISGIRIEVE